MSDTQNESSSSKPSRKRRRRRSGGQGNSNSSAGGGGQQNQPQGNGGGGGGKSGQRKKGRGGNRNRGRGQGGGQGRGGRGGRGSGNSTRKRNADRGSGGVYHINRPSERPTPALWRRFLEKVTFGAFKADPYFVPGSERFAKPKSESDAPARVDNKPKKKKSGAKRRVAAEKQAKQAQQPRAKKVAKKPREPKPKGPPEIVEATTARVYVGNLSYEASEEDLKALFAGAGKVESAEVVTNARTKRSKGYAFVTMGSVSDAQAAVAMLQEYDLKGRNMVVSGAKSSGREGKAATSEAAEAPAES